MTLRCKPGTALAAVSAILLSAAVLLSLADPLATANAQPQLTSEQLANLQPLDPSQVPTYGTFWELFYGSSTGRIMPAPLPMNPYGTNVPVYWLGDDQYFIANGPDDVNLLAQQQQQLRAETAMFQPMDANGTIDQPDGAGPLDAALPPGTFYICSIGVTNQIISLVLTNTAQDILYDIQSKDQLTNTADWVTETTVPGLSNATPVTLWMGNRTNQLWLRARSWVDSSGSGIPDWWRNLYGINGGDPFALCPSGDGWTLLQAFQNGWNPWDWHTPPAPTGLNVSYYGATSNVIVQWNPSPGPATNYVVRRFVAWSGQTNYFSNNGQTIFADAPPSGGPDPSPTKQPAYQVMAQYPGGPSAWSGPVSLFNPATSLCVPPVGISYSDDWLHTDYGYGNPDNLATGVNASVVRGPQGHLYLVTGTVPPGVAAVRVSALPNPDGTPSYPVGPEANYLWENPQPFTTSPSSGYFDVSAAALQTGFCELPAWLTPLYGSYSIKAQAVAEDGTLSECAPFSGFPQDMWSRVYPTGNGAVPFLDGRRQIKENAEFQLRAAASQQPFTILQENNGADYLESGPLDYVVAGFHFLYTAPLSRSTNLQGSGLVLDEFRPFEQNYLYANFLLNGPPWSDGYYLNTNWDGTGTPDWYYDTATVNQPWSQFHAGAFAQSGATNSIPDLLPQSATDWIYLNSIFEFAYDDPTTRQWLISDYPNLYGLKLQSVQAWSSDDATFGVLTTFYPGQGISWDHYWPVFFDFERPQLQITNYYFARAPRAFHYAGSGATVPDALDPRPGEPGFTTSAQTPLLVAPIGQPLVFNAWAKEALLNGFPDTFAYTEQYFENALTIGADGRPTTNSAGLLSPYGEFFPMMPGPVALVTMPDIDPPYQRGTGVVNVIKLQLDVNHDGNMDLSFGGPDNTSQARPFVFWINNDFDRSAKDNDDGVYYEDSVEEWTGPWYIKTQQTPDGYYRDKDNNRVIPTMRDLEDFARLWVCGITSNLLASLPTGSTVTLDWGDVGNPNTNNPTIDLFQAADSDGGIGYLTNAATASVQTNAWVSWYAGQLGPGGRILLNDSFYTNAWAGNHFIWCGLQRGSGKLNLTISDAQSNVLAQTSAWVELRDIKEMYERRTVGENPNLAPTNHASMVQGDLPPGISSFQYGAPSDTNTPYILFVHGWNLDTYMKDRFAETAFKRLYWQGYQGRFGTFRWPTDYGFKASLLQMLLDISQKDNFDRSEYQAYKSAPGLLDLLTQLHATYGNNLYLYSVSHGNMVCGEALRLAGSSRLVNTYLASQAAVTAHTYDPTVPNYSFIYPGVCYSPKTPNIYGNWFAGNKGHAAGQIINFFNANDYALQRSVWQLNQLMKPDQLVAQSDRTWNYAYNGSSSDLEPWNNFYKYCTTNAITNAFDIVNTLTNRYEVMAFAAQSWTTALGATPQGGTPGVLTNISINVDLSQIWPPDSGNYSAHFWHSGQFRGPYWHQQNYWRAFLSQESGLNLHWP